MKFKALCLYAEPNAVDVIEHYSVNGARVYITKDGRYLVVEPELTSEAHEIYSKMLEVLFYSLKPLTQSPDPVSYIEEHIWKEAEDLAIVDKVKNVFEQLRYYLVRDVVGYGITDVLMKDDDVEEVTCERYDRNVGVVHRRYTQYNILDTNIMFGSADAMNSYIQRIMQKTGKSVTAAVPVMDAVTKEGDRIMVTYASEVSLPGPTISIRKFPRTPYTITHLLKFNTISRLMAAYLWILLDAKAFGLIVGETSAGKTTMINSLMCLTNPRWKIVTIEETPELQMPHYRWQRLFTRSSPMITESKFDVNVMDLIKASLRMRPDFEIVGEVRGEEAHALFQSAATGHGGLTSVHASSAEAALGRLSSEPINIKTSQQMLLWFILHITRVKAIDGSIVRRVISITEVVPKQDSVELVEVFRYVPKIDIFEPSDMQELVQRSARLKQAGYMLNIDPLLDLQKRISLLDRCMEENASTVQQVFGILGRYYL